MQTDLKILILEDSPTDAELLVRFLRKEIPGTSFRLTSDREGFVDALEHFRPDIILSDHSLPQFDSEAALQIIRKHYPGIPFILVTGTVSEEHAVNIIKLGADDYVLKDRIRRLPAAIATSLQKRKSESSIRQSEAIRKLIMNSALDAIVCTDTSGEIIVWTPQAEKMFGWAEAEILGKKLTETIIPPSYREKHIRGFARYLETGEEKILNRVTEVEALHKAGKVFPVELLIIPVQEEEGKFLCAFIRDITERRKIEKILIESEKKYRSLFYQSPLPQWIYDPESLCFLDVNEAAISHYGYTREEFLVMTIRDIRPADDLGILEEEIRRIQEGKDSRKGVWRHLKKDGECITVEITSHTIAYNNRNARIVTANDITEKLKAAAEIQKSNERFSFVTMSISDIIWEQDFETGEYQVHEGREKLVNGFDMFLDWKQGLDGKAILKEDRIRVKRSFMEARNDPARILWEDEYRIRSSGDSVLYIANHAIFIRDATGKAQKAYGAISNITERKILEMKLREQQREEQQRITAIALEAQERERNAIAVELHDSVNQILVGTRLNLSMIREASERTRELVDTSMTYLQEVIEEIRKLAHSLVSPDLESETLAEQVKGLCKSMLEITGIKVTLDASLYNDSVLDDKRKIAAYRIAQEQCTNIVKYAGASAVYITLRTEGRLFSMCINDNGRGMKSDHITTGIGLRNINSRLSVFNGKVEIKTAPGSGFELTVEIPLPD